MIIPTGPDQHGRGVLLIGVGGLGNAAALALASAGIQRLGVVDDDVVALSNLQRQVLFQECDLGKKKVNVVAEHLQARFPACQVEAIAQRVNNKRAIATLAADYHVILDGSDNFTTRFAANDAAVAYGFPLVHGAATGTRGQLISIAAGGKPCLRCLFYEPPSADTATCRSEGVFGPLVGEVGWLMAMAAVKQITGYGQPLFGQLLTIDALQAKRRIIPLSHNPDCPVCPKPSI